MKHLYPLLGAGLHLWFPLFLSAQTDITIFPGDIVRDIEDNPTGINVNTWVDNDSGRPVGARTLRTALDDTGTRFMRFPGGEKADGYIWAEPPYNDPSTATVLRRGPTEYPYSDPAIFDSLTNQWVIDNYHFDLFMADCQAIDCEPIIVVALDNIYKPAEPGGSTLTRQQTLDMAVAWVQYANVTMGYNIKYWMLGNETWNINGYNGQVPPMGQYGIDAREFSQAMKAVDPTILTGINGNSYGDFFLALEECGNDVDWLDVHSYPAFGFTTYREYVETDLSAPTNELVEGAELASLYYDGTGFPRQVMPVTVSETSAYGYSPEMGGTADWDTGNNLGQALANFDMMATNLSDARITFSQFWNTRWINEDDGISHGTDLFTATNELNATGRLMKILSEETKDRMVRTTGSAKVKSWASIRRNGEGLTIFMLNKDTLASVVNLDMGSYTADPLATRSVFRGDSTTDWNPEYVSEADLPTNGGTPTLTLPAASLTVLRVPGSMANCTTDAARGGGFEEAGVRPWTTQMSAGGFAGRITDGNVHEGKGSGYAGGGPASFSQSITGLQPNSDYILSAQVRYFTKENSPVRLGVSGFGGTDQVEEIGTGGGFQEYQNYSIPFTTGPTGSSASIFFENLDAQSFGWIDEVEVICDAATFVLPVELLAFTGTPEAEHNELKWTVQEERDLDHYEVQSSPDGSAWRVRGTVAATSPGKSRGAYTFLDPEVRQTRLYRLKMVDIDGTTKFSPTIHVGRSEQAAGYLPFPNPTVGPVHLPSDWRGDTYSVLSVLGKEVLSGQLPAGGRLNLGDLPSGVYHLSVGDRPVYRVVKR